MLYNRTDEPELIRSDRLEYLLPLLKHRSPYWSWETLGLATSIASLCASITMLAVYDGAELPHWPLGLTLNACVAVFSVVTKASLMVTVSEAIGQAKWDWYLHTRQPKPLSDFQAIDEASRGPYGSALILIRWIRPRLVTLGALVTLLTLFMDPFAQQVVGYETIKISKPSASLAKATSAHALYKARTTVPNSPVPAYANARLSSSTIAALYAGIFANETQHISQALPMRTCPTSNCTWPSFTTVGICSSCTDLTPKLNIQINCPAPASPDITECVQKCTSEVISGGGQSCLANCAGQQETGGVTQVGPVCGASLPSPTDQKIPLVTLDIQSGHLAKTQLLRNAANPGGPNISIAYADFATPLIDLVSIGHSSDPTITGHNFTTATECILYACARTYSSTFSAGHISETVLATSANRTQTLALDTQVNVYPKPNNFPLVSFPISPPRNASSSDPSSSHNDPSSSHNTSSQTESVDEPDPEIGIEYQEALATWLSSPSHGLASGSITYAPNQSNINTSSDVMSLIWGHMSSTPDRSQEDGYAANTLPHFYAQLATSLTSSLRNAGSTSERITGLSWSDRTVVRVRWGWMSLPAGLVLLGVVFCFAVGGGFWGEVCKGKGKAGRFWGNSALPVLYADVIHGRHEHGSAEEKSLGARYTGLGQGQGMSLRELEREAKETFVSLQQTEMGAFVLSRATVDASGDKEMASAGGGGKTGGGKSAVRSTVKPLPELPVRGGHRLKGAERWM